MKKIILLFIAFFELLANDNFKNFYPDFNAVQINFNSNSNFYHKGEGIINNKKYQIYKKIPELIIDSIYKNSNTNNVVKQYKISYKIQVINLTKNKNIYEKTNTINTYNESKILDYINSNKMEFFIRDFKINANDIMLIELEIQNIYDSNTNTAMFLNTSNKPKIAFIYDETGDNINKFMFGSIWKIFDNKPSINEELRPKLSDLENDKAKIANKAYTRVAGNDIYIGLLQNETANKIKFYSNTDRVKNINNIIIYKKCDFNGCSKDYVVNPDGVDGNGLPTGDYVIEFINTTIGKHDICYEELNKQNTVIKKECREFMVRPARIQLDDINLNVDDSFQDTITKIKATIYDTQDRVINVNNLGVKLAKLKVYDSLSNEYKFDLENINYNKVSKTTPAMINKSNELELKIGYPFSNEGKIEFLENDFVGDDILNDKCHTNGFSNTVNVDGKISCNVKINEVNINFKSNSTKSLEDIKTSNNLSDAVLFSDEVIGQSEADLGKCFGLGCDFTHSLELPIVIKNHGIIDNNKLVYKYFPNDISIEFDLKFLDNNDTNADKRYRIYTNTLKEELINITNQNIKMNFIATKNILNKPFDKKLSELNKDVNINNKKLSDIAKNYLAKEKDLEFITKIGYTKFHETNQYAPTNKAIINPMASEFSIDKTSTIKIDGVDTILSNNYSFIFASASYKDLKAPKNSKYIKLLSTDLNLNYIDKNGKISELYNTKSTTGHYYLESIENIVNSIIFNSDYNSTVTKLPKGEVLIELDKNKQNNEYVKDLIRTYSTNVISSNSSFSIEFR
ncbi:hypothetical protein [Campylobacter sp. MG1]|uniref:hypothetical protein n=1 Tax=Campylobacter sp. MG1 TaxID=2976332 RepID=UPI00226CC314|nr:hypothetical protein [Campylobacter sp. MG1]